MVIIRYSLHRNEIAVTFMPLFFSCKAAVIYLRQTLWIESMVSAVHSVLPKASINYLYIYFLFVRVFVLRKRSIFFLLKSTENKSRKKRVILRMLGPGLMR